jgi:hypothetical protein
VTLMRLLWARIAVSALTALRPFLRMDGAQSAAYDVVLELLRSL